MKEKTYVILLVGALVCVLTTSLFIKSSIDLEFSGKFTVIDLPIFGMIAAGISVMLAIIYKVLFRKNVTLQIHLIRWHLFLSLFAFLFIIIACMRPPIIFDDVKGVFDKIRWSFIGGVVVFIFAQGILLYNVFKNVED